MIKYISLFSGIGGFEYGINNAFKKLEIKSKCVFSSEIDKYARQIYEKNFGVESYGDIKGINEQDIPDHDLLVAGFPCQSFSTDGNRKGFNDTRGTLFFEIARAAEYKRPKILLLENVRGLLSHDQGRTFETILKTLDNIGYDVEWQVLNSKNFGVPQNRERVFIIGHLRGKCSRKIFPITEKNRSITRIQGQCTNTLTRRYNESQTTGSYIIEGKFKGKVQQGIVTENIRIRKLTPIECERLQGFPDNWTESISDNQRYKCLGNAVTTNVIEAIIKKLYK